MCIFLISRQKMLVLILEDVFFPACEPMQKTQVVVTDIKSLNALNVCIYVLCCHKQLKMFLSVISGNCNLTNIVWIMNRWRYLRWRRRRRTRWLLCFTFNEVSCWRTQRATKNTTKLSDQGNLCTIWSSLCWCISSKIRINDVRDVTERHEDTAERFWEEREQIKMQLHDPTKSFCYRNFTKQRQKVEKKSHNSSSYTHFDSVRRNDDPGATLLMI